MKTVCIIGAGNIGSRHLQGLKKVNFPLVIEVVDPSLKSLKTAKERYNQVSSTINHQITFLQDLNRLSKNIDLAIIATSSNIRREVAEKLLKQSQVHYLILEKILFQKKEDYVDMEKLLKQKGVTSWVNFSIRTMPFYRDLKGKFQGIIQMVVSGSRYGLITNVVHFVDYLAYLTNCYNFKVVTDGLDSRPIESRRKGFLELNGALTVYFQDGSLGTFTCFTKGDAPYIIELVSENYRVISKESERKAWISQTPSWVWHQIESNIPYQSDMTNVVVEEILSKGRCLLAPYSQASKLHLQVLESLIKFLNIHSKMKFNFYPFT